MQRGTKNCLGCFRFWRGCSFSKTSIEVKSLRSRRTAWENTPYVIPPQQQCGRPLSAQPLGSKRSVRSHEAEETSRLSQASLSLIYLSVHEYEYRLRLTFIRVLFPRVLYCCFFFICVGKRTESRLFVQFHAPLLLLLSRLRIIYSAQLCFPCDEHVGTAPTFAALFYLRSQMRLR